MELRPIFKALLKNRVRFILISLEVAITFAVVINCITMVVSIYEDLNRPTGFDVNNLIAVEIDSFGKAFKDEAYIDAVRDEDLRRVRALPGVRAAGGISNFPLGGMINVSAYRPLGSNIADVKTPYIQVTDDTFKALGVTVVQGRDFIPSDFGKKKKDGGTRHWNVIVTKEMSQAFFPNEDAVGKTLEGHSSTATIVGIVSPMLYSPPPDDRADQTMFFPGKPGTSGRMNYVVRTEPNMVASFIPELEALLLDHNNQRSVLVMPYEDVRERMNDGVKLFSEMLIGIILLLVSVTLTGILGATAYAVTERTNQIGTRRALGATRFQVVRYFVVESGIMVGAGILIGAMGAMAINWGISVTLTASTLNGPIVVWGAMILWITGILATLVPALRAASIPPALATRV